jgi:hypothetical protein
LSSQFIADRKKHKTQANGKIKKMSGKTKTAALTAFAAAGKKGGAFGIITAVSSGDNGSSGGGDPPPSDSEIKAGSLLKGGNAFGQPGQLGSWRSSRSQQPKMDSISEKVKNKVSLFFLKNSTQIFIVSCARFCSWRGAQRPPEYGPRVPLLPTAWAL